MNRHKSSSLILGLLYKLCQRHTSIQNLSPRFDSHSHDIAIVLARMNHLTPREVIRDELIPKAISWYTGEAGDEDDEDEDEDEDDSDGDDGDEVCFLELTCSQSPALSPPVIASLLTLLIPGSQKRLRGG